MRTPGAHAEEIAGQQIAGLARMPLHNGPDKSPFTMLAHAPGSITLAYIIVGPLMKDVTDKSKTHKNRPRCNSILPMTIFLKRMLLLLYRTN